MAHQEMLYFELKTNQNDRGPAWIGLATLAGSSRTVYFNGKALNSAARSLGLRQEIGIPKGVSNPRLSR